jgi:hypothetical protein
VVLALVLLAAAGCTTAACPPATRADGERCVPDIDAGRSAAEDAGANDAGGESDAGSVEDAGAEDAGAEDAGAEDASPGVDAARADGGPACVPVEETCDGFDQDCDGSVDEGVDLELFEDNDLDGYGTRARTRRSCVTSRGWATRAGDCDDRCADCRPDGTETCNARDEDCDSMIDEGVGTTFSLDCDGDGYAPTGATTYVGCVAGALPGSCPSGVWIPAISLPAQRDCLDSSADVRPGQLAFFSAPIAGVPAGRDYDYDCDGAESAQGVDLYECTPACGTARQGWFLTIPACGATAEWVTTCSLTTSCRTVREARAQGCR